MKKGKYRHFKGKLYEVVGVALHSETLERFVVYRALYKHPEPGMNSLWVRPEAMFIEKVVTHGKKVPRFAPVVSGPARPRKRKGKPA